MCGITGWVDWRRDLRRHPECLPLLERMTDALTLRGPDAQGTWVTEHCALGHRRLSVIDPENGQQPMVRTTERNEYIIVYNGELYNAPELRKELELRGHVFRTNCDTEVLLLSYIEWGAACVDRLAGIYAFAVWDEMKERLFLARDRLGVKPLFYAHLAGKFVFGSEPKSILMYPDIQPKVGAEGFAEIFAVGPARTPGHGIYKQLAELKPGQFAQFDRSGLRIQTYWKLESHPHTDSEEETIEHVRELLLHVTNSQLVSDVPLCTLLSGGLDSSALTALAKRKFVDEQKLELHTFSVDYAGNDQHFQANAFQPDSDAPWIRRISDFLGTKHHYVELSTEDLVESLIPAVTARDLPGMADIDGSLLLFARSIKQHATVALSGEGADEVFGGYPWFFREEMLHAGTFPWSIALDERLSLLSPELIDWVKPRSYVSDRYEEALGEVPRLHGEDEAAARMRELSYLNITRFMQTLLDRKDRMSMAASLEVRVPFCDHRIIEYVWNIPWAMKTIGGREKGLLREALRGFLPDDVLFRKKSPYPKTYDPAYVSALQSRVISILDDASSPILPFIDAKKVRAYAGYNAAQLQRPWFGQLMSGPQMLAYIIQVNYWMKEYNVS